MELEKRHDTTGTTDFCSHQPVTDLIRRNYCRFNGFWPYLDTGSLGTHNFTDRIAIIIKPMFATLLCFYVLTVCVIFLFGDISVFACNCVFVLVGLCFVFDSSK